MSHALLCALVVTQAAELLERHPRRYAARGVELAAEAEAEAARRQLHRHVYLGNLHTLVDQVGQGTVGKAWEVGLAIS